MTANRNAPVAVAVKLNVVRRRISVLRSRMLATEDLIRKQIGRDQDCTDISLRLMVMRTKMLRLLADRKIAWAEAAAAKCRRTAEGGTSGNEAVESQPPPFPKA